MLRSFTVLQCSHQHCVQPVASDVEVVGYREGFIPPIVGCQLLSSQLLHELSMFEFSLLNPHPEGF